MFNRKHSLQCAQLHTTLITTATDCHHLGILPRKMSCGNRSRRPGAQNGDLNSIHHCQRKAVGGIAEDDLSLNVWHGEALLVVREIAIELGGKVRSWAQQRGLDVKSAIRGGHSQDFRRRNVAFPMLPKRALDCRDAVVQGEQFGNVRSREQQSPCRFVHGLPGAAATVSTAVRSVSGETSTGGLPRRKMRALRLPCKTIAPF